MRELRLEIVAHVAALNGDLDTIKLVRICWRILLWQRFQSGTNVAGCSNAYNDAVDRDHHCAKDGTDHQDEYDHQQKTERFIVRFFHGTDFDEQPREIQQTETL